MKRRRFLPSGILCLSVLISAQGQVQFLDVTAESGIAWVHDNVMTPQRYEPETVGGGCGFLDYDRDGWMDIYLVNGGETSVFKPKKPIRNALYRNRGDGTFRDVTEAAGVAGHGYGFGMAAADYDADGWTDLLVTGLDFSILYRNNREGTFSDVTDKAGIKTQAWSTSAAWLDYNNDGHLDLYVCGFVPWSPELPLCGAEGAREYCIPWVYPGAPSWLFRNNGDGTFQDVSTASGVGKARAKSLGVVTFDFNNDGWIDLFEANDTDPNRLLENKGDGTFEEVGLLAGVALSRHGKERSSMGTAAQDYDDDGLADLFVDNINYELYSLYRNNGDKTFSDRGIFNLAMVKASYLMSGWGVQFLDFDNDGDDDLFVVNGHPNLNIFEVQPPVTYAMPLRLFENVDGHYHHVSERSGDVFARTYPSRGMAAGDYDNDGDVDVLVCNVAQAPLLLRNEGGNRNRWLRIHLIGRPSNRAGIGAWITYTVDGKQRFHHVAAGGSYLSSHDPRILLGAGRQQRIKSLKVKWPSGTVDILTDVRINRSVQLHEGMTGAPR